MGIDVCFIATRAPPQSRNQTLYSSSKICRQGRHNRNQMVLAKTTKLPEIFYWGGGSKCSLGFPLFHKLPVSTNFQHLKKQTSQPPYMTILDLRCLKYKQIQIYGSNKFQCSLRELCFPQTVGEIIKAITQFILIPEISEPTMKQQKSLNKENF